MAHENLVHLNQKIPESTKVRLKREADRRGLKLGFVVSVAVLEWVERMETEQA